MAVKEALRLVQEAMASVQKQFGKGSVMRLGEEDADMPPVEVTSTGSLGVDLALGIGGLPRGRIVEVFGPEASGKTTLALHTIAACHRAGGYCSFIDAEHALDLTYARNLGVEPDKLLISQPDSGEQALEICEMLVRSGGISLVVVDSVAALVPRAEIEGEMGDAHMGLQARLMSQAMRKLTSIAHRTGCTILFINQLRHKIGAFVGNPETTTGGNALKFYASVRIDVRRIGSIKDGTSFTGSRTRIKVVKNKLAPPFREVEVDVLFGRGIWWAGDLLDRALDRGILSKSGSWISWDGEQLGQGREKVAQRLEAEPELAARVRQAVLEAEPGLSIAACTPRAHPAGEGASAGEEQSELEAA